MNVILGLLFIVFFVLPFFSKGKAVKKQGKKATRYQARVDTHENTQKRGASMGSEPINWGQSRNMGSGNNRPKDKRSKQDLQAALRLARRAALMKARGRPNGEPAVRDPADLNRSRRDDWGVRSTDGLFSGRNIISALVGLAILLYILSKISA